MKSGKISQNKKTQADVPGRKYAIYAASWFPELEFLYPYSPGYGDADVPEYIRRRIDSLLDCAKLRNEMLPYSESQLNAFGSVTESPTQNAAKIKESVSPRLWKREIERSRSHMRERRRRVIDLFRAMALSEKALNQSLAAIEDYAQAAFEHGFNKGQFEEFVQQQIFREYKRVDAAANTRKATGKAAVRTIATREFLKHYPVRRSSAHWVRHHGEKLRAYLISRRIQPLKTDESQQKEISRITKLLKN